MTTPRARPSGDACELLDLGDQDDLLQQVLDAEGLQGRHLDGDGVAAPGLGHEPVLRQLLEHPVGVGLVAVDLVDGHDDRHVGRVGVADGLDGLGHDAVVGGHHQDHDVGHLGTTGTHGREGLVAGGVDERDRVALPLDLVGADVLGDATGLAGHDVGRADAVEQQGLAVVDVAHDGDDRRAGPQLRLVHLLVVVVEELGQQLGLALLARIDQSDLGAELGGEQLDHVVGQRLGGRDHLPLQQQEADHVTGGAVQLGTEVAGRRAALDDDLVLGHGRRRGRVRGEGASAPAPRGSDGADGADAGWDGRVRRRGHHGLRGHRDHPGHRRGRRRGDRRRSHRSSHRGDRRSHHRWHRGDPRCAGRRDDRHRRRRGGR